VFVFKVLVKSQDSAFRCSCRKSLIFGEDFDICNEPSF
jgi:hypothetical protein